jgi:hypothetical protein
MMSAMALVATVASAASAQPAPAAPAPAPAPAAPAPAHAAPAPASAEPVSAPPSCSVEILRAPPEVQAVIEDWVRAERACGPALKVRVVPTAGGLYLLAEDATGRVRERVVPDATTAGVLVASWAADDGGNPVVAAPVAVALPAAPIAPAPVIAMEPPAPVPAPPPPVPAPPPPVSPAAAPPVPASAPIGIRVVAPGPAREDRSIDLGVLIGRDRVSGDAGAIGGTLGLDLVQRFGLRVGVAAGFSTDRYTLMTPIGYGETSTAFDLRIVGRVALDRHIGKLSARVELGLGAIFSEVSSPTYGTARGAAPYGELGVTVGYQVLPRWRMRGGPVVSAAAEQFNDPVTGTNLTRGQTIGLWVGLDHPL